MSLFFLKISKPSLPDCAQQGADEGALQKLQHRLTAVLFVRVVATVVGAVANLAQVHAALAAALHGARGTLGARDLHWCCIELTEKTHTHLMMLRSSSLEGSQTFRWRGTNAAERSPGTPGGPAPRRPSGPGTAASGGGA